MGLSGDVEVQIEFNRRRADRREADRGADLGAHGQDAVDRLHRHVRSGHAVAAAVPSPGCALTETIGRVPPGRLMSASRCPVRRSATVRKVVPVGPASTIAAVTRISSFAANVYIQRLWRRKPAIWRCPGRPSAPGLQNGCQTDVVTEAGTVGAHDLHGSGVPDGRGFSHDSNPAMAFSAVVRA